VSIAQSFHLRNVRQGRRELAFECPVIAQENGAPLELDLQIGIVREFGPIIVICRISVDDLSFEFAPTGQNISDQGCHVRIADETPSLTSKSLPTKKERRTLSGSSPNPSRTNSDKYSLGPMPGIPMLINSTLCPLCF